MNAPRSPQLVQSPQRPQQPAATEPAAVPSRRRFGSLAGLAALGGGLALLSLGSHAASETGGAPGGPSPEKRERHMMRRISHMLDEVDATPEQRSKIVAIARATLADLKPLREQQRAGRQRGMQLLSAPTIDRAAIEQTRLARAQAHDQLSKRMTQSLIDTAEVLTPAQRVKLAERMQGRMGRHHGRHDHGEG